MQSSVSLLSLGLPLNTYQHLLLRRNYPDHYPEGTSGNVKIWKFGMDRVYLPFYRRFMIGDKGVLKSGD